MEKTQCFLWFLPRLISLTVMAEENPQQRNSGEHPSQAPQQQTGQEPTTPQGPGSAGQRRSDRRDRPRHLGGRRDYHRRDQQPPPRPAAPEKPEETAGTDEDIDEEESGSDRASPQQRHHRRGGRPPKKIVEEWANDPYCE